MRVADCGGKILYSSEAGVRLEDGPLFPLPPGKHELACGPGLVAATADRDVHLFDLSGRALGVLAGHTERVVHLAVSADGKRVASASLDRTVRLWDAQSRKALAVLLRPAPPVWVDFACDGQQIAVGEQQNALLLWDVSAEQRGVSGSFTDFAFLPGGGYLAGGSAGVIGRWGQDGKLAGSMREEGAVLNLAVSPSGALMADLRKGGVVSVWDLGKSALPSRFIIHPPQDDVIFLPDGSLLLRGQSGAPSIRDAATGRVLRELPAPASPIEDWHVTPDGRLLVMQLASGQLARLDLATGKALPKSALQASAIALSAGSLLHLQVEGSTSALGGVRFLHLGNPASLPEPAEALRQVLDDHGVLLHGGDIEPSPPPVTAVSDPAKAP